MRRPSRSDLRILVVSSVFPNAEQPTFGTFVAERVRAYARRAEVTVIAPVPWFPRYATSPVFGRWGAAGRIPDESELDGVRVLHSRRVVVPKLGEPTAGPLYARALKRTLAELRTVFPFDIVDAHFVWPDGYAAVQASPLEVPVCITAQGTDLNLMPSLLIVRRQLATALNRATRVVSVCESLAKECFDLGCPPEKLHVIPPGVDPNRFPLTPVAEARAKLEIPLGRRILLSVGSLIPRKGQSVLIDAVSRIVSSKRCDADDIELVLVGEGPDQELLQRRARRNGITERVRFVGSVAHDRVADWMNASDLFCLASTREGWPTVLFEAMACGLPVLASDPDGSAEAITNPEVGIRITRNEPSAWADAIECALRRSWTPRRLREYALQNTWDHVAADTFEVFEGALRDKGRVRQLRSAR